MGIVGEGMVGVAVHKRISPLKADPDTHEYTPGLVSPHIVEPT